MKKLLLSILMSVISLSTYAADGSSGCGPGWYVVKDNSLLSSALRATTNGILLPTSTLGMTFGTSNCSKHSIVKLEKERLKFATENYFEIASESAKGNGEFLSAYGELMGCSTKSLGEFSKKMQSKMKTMFVKENINPENLVKRTYMMILQDNKLTQACFQA